MANVAIVSGYILSSKKEDRAVVLEKIKQLPEKPYEDEFCIWRGIFHALEDPNRAGFIITFGLSHKYFGEQDKVGEFLNFWESFIVDLPADELFIALEQEFTYSEEPFSKFYFQWKNKFYPKSTEKRWVFCGKIPIDEKWKSRFETNL